MVKASEKLAVLSRRGADQLAADDRRRRLLPVAGGDARRVRMHGRRPAARHAGPASASDQRRAAGGGRHRADAGGGARHDPHPVLAEVQRAAARRCMVVANRVHAGAPAGDQPQGLRRLDRAQDRSSSSPFDQKLAAQAAKLGKPLAEAGKNSKTVAPIVELARPTRRRCRRQRRTRPRKGDSKAKGASLIGKFDLKALLTKRAKK